MYKIYDNILSEQTITKIYDYIASSKFPWYCSNTHNGRTMSDEYAKQHPEFQNSIQLVHPILSGTFSWEDHGVNRSYTADKNIAIFESNIVNSMVMEFFHNTNKSLENIILYRSKCNLMMQSLDKRSNPPHIDIFDINHQVLLYYVNDSDGDTIIYQDNKEKQIIDKISPKKGRILFFDGHHYHSSTPPSINTNRIVINSVLVDKKDIVTLNNSV